MELLTEYPAFWLAFTSIISIGLTILTADKAPSRKAFISDMMLLDRSSIIAMSVGMIVAGILTPYTVLQFNFHINSNLYLFSYFVLIASIFFIITLVLLWFKRYELHLFAIRGYFLFALLAELIAVFYVGQYFWLFLGLVIINILILVITYLIGKVRWLCEVSFWLLTLVYLILLNLITLNIL